ncbi:HWE histidine kinase domain-containing protein [Ciceribacter sp. L1K22]|uniref:HWE histidine kinase domain-containing protein n=1 Tax=Ciceribacter sp. L1K22 TaxID=2820275 RepID=UPI001ABE9666|nr:HWE histidine kinase domain-containing protein [Ciceribacter sp. L1K22]MBO3761270.1 GAF domain-containing protein [Ciceribacter sp. L1K22]
MHSPLPPQAVNLTNCDREPIHIPGSIQSHGCLLACDAVAARVLRHSANAAEMLGFSGNMIGANLNDVVGSQASHDLRNALAAAPQASRPALLQRVLLENGKFFDVSLHRHAGHAIIEFEACDEVFVPLHLARELIGRIRQVSRTDQLLRLSATLLKAVLGYDRVMIYRFDADGAGKVESEAKRPDLESFLGQYFPASDIPQQARALYVKNPIRIISDASGSRIPIEPVLDQSGEPLDLSFAHLRSVSPIHLEYLRNMGVAASMSISIIVEGALWGLIACHHYSPKNLSLPQRVAAEMFGEFFSMHLIGLLQRQKLDVVTMARRALDRFFLRATEYGDVAELLVEVLPDFKSLLPCDGIGVLINGKWHGLGTTPPADAIPSLAEHVAAFGEHRIWATHMLADIHPRADVYFQDVSGLLAIPLSRVTDDCLMFFRKERLQTLNWAGNPEKSYETGPIGDRLTPRKSFDIWKQTVERQSEPWSEADREIAAAIHSATVEVVLRQSELMQEERDKAEVRQRLLNEELNHRVKNILAVIKSLIAGPARESATLVDYVTSLKGRIQALSHAHDQVIRGSGGGEIGRLLEAELSPYRTDINRLGLEGPTVLLDGRAYAVTALVIHELCTNAAKYGSLSRSGGTLEVSWELLDQGDLQIRWTESGGPPVDIPMSRGFGSALIDRSIPFDLGGKSKVTYDPGGVKATLVIPGRFLSVPQDQTPNISRSPATMGDTEVQRRTDMSLLLVEDQILIAMDAETMLADNGIQDVVTANSSDMALTHLKTFTPDVALLDINLGSGTSVPVAEELVRRGIPFIFATGYDDRTALPQELLSVPVVRKPYDADELISAINRRLADRIA